MYCTTERHFEGQITVHLSDKAVKIYFNYRLEIDVFIMLLNIQKKKKQI